MTQGRLPPVTRRELIRRLRRFGWEGPYQGRRHSYMVKGQQKLQIPNSHPGNIGVDLLRRILTRAGIPRSDWLNA